MDADRFLVRQARQIAVDRLPAKVKNQFAFRHFYTEELDGTSGHLSVKFLSLVVRYFCAIFKLEGRRRQYEERPSDKSGKDFARAHRGAQLVFQQLACTYSVIVMRYSCHHVLHVRTKVPGAFPGARSRPGRDIREPAFRYASDEMVFFELLYQVTADVVRMAFEGDATVQELAVEETNRLFRSKSYLFHAQQRSDDMARVVTQLDDKANGLLENTTQLAELLVPPNEKLMMKHANQQRSPFLACQLPGGTSYLKYQRVRRANGATLPTAAERSYKVEMTTCPFPPDHRAMANVARLRPSRTSSPKVADTSSPKATDTMPSEETLTSSAMEGTGSGPMALNPEDLTAPSPDVEQRRPKSFKRAASSLAHRGRPRGASAMNHSQSIVHEPVATDDDDDVEVAELERFLCRPASEWVDTDLNGELGAIYQALANGVVVTQFSIPLDLKLAYDAQGILLAESLPDVS